MTCQELENQRLQYQAIADSSRALATSYAALATAATNSANTYQGLADTVAAQMASQGCGTP